MADRGTEWEVEPLFDDVDVGDLEGWKIEDYRTWKHHARDEPFPGGESLNGAARRYAEAFQALLARAPASWSSRTRFRSGTRSTGWAARRRWTGPRTIPNSVPYLFDEEGLQRAVAGIETVVGKVSA